MGLISRLLGIEDAVKKTLKESYPFLPGTPAPGSLDFQYKPDQDGFLPVGFYRKRSKLGDNPQAYLNEEDLRRARENSRDLSVSNEYARNGLTNRRNYIVGTGFKVTAEPVDTDAPNDELEKATNEWLQRYAAITKRCEKEKEAVMRGDRDGECFLRLTKARVLEYHFVEPEYVGNWDGETPFGIRTDPKNITKVIAYLVKNGDGDEYETVPAEEMIHVKLNTDSGIKRGLPFLYPVASILRKIESTIENMATTVAIMAAIAMVRRRPFMSASAVDSANERDADFTGPNPLRAGGSDNYKQYRAGTILDVDGSTEYEFPANSINLGGVVNVKQSLLQTAAAGMGLAEYMLTSDCSNGNLSTTQVGESPVLMGFVAMQHFWADAFGTGLYVDEAEMGLTWRAIEYAVENGDLDAAVLTEIQLKTEGPSIEVRDKNQETQRNKVLADDGIISRDAWAAKEGHGKAHVPDEEMQARKDKELQATQSHELKMASAKGAAKQGGKAAA